MDGPRRQDGEIMFTSKPPAWAVQLQKDVRIIMALVSVDQASLDALAGQLEAVKTSLAAEIASLQTALPAADLGGLTKALADLAALEPPAPAPTA